MKVKIIFFISLLQCAITIKAQEQDQQLSSVSLSVVLPDNVDGLNESHLSKLGTKIIEIATNNGVSADGYSQNFVIYPKFEVYSEKESKGGMRSVTVIECNVSLFIKQLSTNIIFSSCSKSLQGSGSNKNDALNNALSQLSSEDVQLNEFIKKGKAKIIAYYQTNCSVILQKAETEISLKKYESSIALLLTVPAEATNCYSQAQAKAKLIFTEFQRANCAQYMQKVRTLAAAANYDEALQAFNYIDASGPCRSESKQLISSISSKVDIERKKEWDFILKRYSDQVELQKANIQAMNNLAIGWIKSQSGAISYITVIK